MSYKEATKKSFKKLEKDEPPKEINKIAYQLSHPDAVTPSLGTPGSAGYDLTPCENGIIKPGERKMINTGVHLAIPRNHVGIIQMRGSTAKLGLIAGGGIIDCDYTGPIQMIIHNLSKDTLKYKAHGNPIAQLIIMPYFTDTLHKVDKLEETSRKGGFGSTNKDLGTVEKQSGKCVFKGQIKGKPVNILVDSGADDDFINDNMARELNLKITNLEKPYMVRLPDGSSSRIYQTVENLKYSIQGHQGMINLHVTPLKINSIIFGNTWLAKYNPDIDWKQLTARFRDTEPPVIIKAENKNDIEWISPKEFALLLNKADEDTHLY
jgi:dUTP pyrophosphatase